MDAFSLASHLKFRHAVDWADDLDADAANRLHAYIHSDRPVDHDHVWDGRAADPQPKEPEHDDR